MKNGGGTPLSNRLWQVIGAACICAAAASAAAATRLGVRAWQHVSNIEAMRSARSHDVTNTTILESHWFEESGVEGSTGTPGAAGVLVVITGEACEPCQETLDALVQMLSASHQLAVPIVIVSNQPADDLRDVLARIRAAGGRVEYRRIRDLERFQAGTGVVKMPTLVLVDSNRDVKAVMLGALQPAGLEPLKSLLSSGGLDRAGGLLVEYGSTALPLGFRPDLDSPENHALQEAAVSD